MTNKKTFKCPYCGNNLSDNGLEVVQDCEAHQDIYIDNKGKIVGLGKIILKNCGNTKFVCKECGRELILEDLGIHFE